jgi:PAS domain S-box-containing protein
MKLQSKITIGLLPLILLSFLALGAWSINTATKGIRRSQLGHLNLLVDTFFQEELEKANTILTKNGLNTVNSFVEDYQKTITENTTKRFAGEKQQVTIFDNSGNVIFCSNPLYNNEDFHKQLRPYLQKTISNSGTSFQGHLDHGAEYFNFVARFFPPWRWHVFITTSDELVHHSISYLKKVTFGIATLSAIGCSLIILLLFKFFLVQPIEKLKTISKAIANRQEIESFASPSNDELGDLAQSIHTMSQDVYAYQESLISGKEVLEKEIQKRTKELEQEKQLVQKYLDIAGVMLVALDTTGRISMINQKGCQLLEVTEEDALGKNWFEHFLPEQIISEVTIVFNRLMADDLNFDENYETHVITSKGQILTIAFHNSVLKSTMGEIIGVLFSGEDITDRRHAEEKLKQSLDLLMNLACLVPGVIYQYRLNLDGSSAFPWSSPGMNDIYEVTPEEVKEDATPVFGRLHPEDLEMVSNAIQESARTLNTFYCEFRVILPRQGLRWRWSQAQPDRTEDGGTLWHGIISDITERKQMEEQTKKLESRLQQSQKMESIGTLAGGIAHDFNNILSPILGYAEMLLEDVPEGSPIRNSLNQIYTSALRAKNLVKQILTFSRQDSNELTLMKMQPIVKEALKLIRSTIPTTIGIKQDINPDCGIIKADPTQIHQIVMNLTTNAYHAMEETGGKLTVSLKQMEFGTFDLINPNMEPGVYVCLTVADTGVGMDKSLTDKIFDPFFTTKAIGKGTGMGLSVVHGIVISMNGAIQVYSEPGKGTQFHVYFPIEKKPFEEQVTHSKIEIQGGTEQILLVDDEEAILSMEKQMLERLGYQVTSRTSSLEALEAFRKNPNKFDMVITDMAMPNMSGEKLSVELTKIRLDIPILLCTGFSETMSEEKAASLGIKDFLLKPIVMKDLAQKIREVLDEN